MATTQYYIDPQLGNDSTGDGSVGSPWASPEPANVLSAPSAGNNYQFNLVGRGLAYPVRGSIANNRVIYPQYNGYSSDDDMAHRTLWLAESNCVVTATQPLSGLTTGSFARVRGSRNVYWIACSADPTYLYAFGPVGYMLGVNKLIPLKFWRTDATAMQIPADSDIYGWTYDSTNAVLIINWPHGDPTESGLVLEYAAIDQAIRLASSYKNHTIQGGVYVGGKLYCSYLGGKGGIHKAYCCYGGTQAIARFSAGTELYYSVLVHSQHSPTPATYGLYLVGGATDIRNNTIYGGNYSVYVYDGSSGYVLANNNFINPKTCFYYVATATPHADFSEDYNHYFSSYDIPFAITANASYVEKTKCGDHSVGTYRALSQVLLGNSSANITDDNTSEAQTAGGDAFDLVIANEYLYIGSPEKFGGVEFDLATLGVDYTCVWQYGKTRSVAGSDPITTGSLSVTVDATAKTFTRGSGSFVTDGFAVGDVIATTGLTTDGSWTITALSALVMTVAGAVGLEDETKTVTITADKVAWTTLSTHGTGANFAADGFVQWAIPSAWSPDKRINGESLYWARVYTSTSPSVRATCNSMRTTSISGLYRNNTFFDIYDRNFRLTLDSPAVNAATTVPTGFTADLEGTTVPFGATPDIGALELEYVIGTVSAAVKDLMAAITSELSQTGTVTITLPDIEVSATGDVVTPWSGGTRFNINITINL